MQSGAVSWGEPVPRSASWTSVSPPRLSECQPLSTKSWNSTLSHDCAKVVDPPAQVDLVIRIDDDGQLHRTLQTTKRCHWRAASFFGTGLHPASFPVKQPQIGIPPASRQTFAAFSSCWFSHRACAAALASAAFAIRMDLCIIPAAPPMVNARIINAIFVRDRLLPVQPGSQTDIRAVGTYAAGTTSRYSLLKSVWRPQRDSNPCFGLERATS